MTEVRAFPFEMIVPQVMCFLLIPDDADISCLQNWQRHAIEPLGCDVRHKPSIIMCFGICRERSTTLGEYLFAGVLPILALEVLG